MKSAIRRYTDEVHDHYSYWATWLPTSRVGLGDLGLVRKRVFEPQTNLEELGITFRPDAPRPALNLQHMARTVWN